MRNFYNQQPNRIFDKMFGKNARQIQADPTLDLTKCNCCKCGSVTCKGCMQGAVMGPGAGCCPSKDESLIFEYERPGQVFTTSCCSDPPSPPGFQCCSTEKVAAPNVRYSYHYLGKFWRIEYNATGNPYRNGEVYGWPQNDLPRLCSYCDPLSNNENGNCDCMDFDGLNPGPIDDYQPGGPCTISSGGCIAPFANCFCMGAGVRRNQDRYNQRLSKYRRKMMERNPYWRWLLDIMCHDKGNIIKNPWIATTRGEPPFSQPGIVIKEDNGTLYNHLIGVIHCEHWWERDICADNPNINFEEEGTEGVNSSCLVPRFWIQACSGVPLFDFEFIDAVEAGYLTAEDLQINVWPFVALKRTPPQDILNQMAEGGYFNTGDWRSEALKEIEVLKGLSYTKNFYDNLEIPVCSDFKYLGPVRKRFYRDNVFQGPTPEEPADPRWALGIPALLDPKLARPNVVNRLPDPVEAESLQLPDEYLRDPWAELGKKYPVWPGPFGSSGAKQEYEEFVTWKNSQWVYMHARPGGWDYVCAGYYDGEPDIKIPDLPRRFNGILTCPNPEELPPNSYDETGQFLTQYGGCLAGILGIPQKTIVTDCGAGGGQCNGVSVPGFKCGSFTCLGVECAPEATCLAYLEQNGGDTPCAGVMIDSNCEGMSIAWSRQTPRPCGADFTDKWITTRENKAWLYKVNITTGEYSSFCPHLCRTLTLPKPITTKFENLYKKRAVHKKYCNAIVADNTCDGQQPIPDGKFCFGLGDCVKYLPEYEVCGDDLVNTEFYSGINCNQWCNPGDGSGAPVYWGPDARCCSKVAGVTYIMDPNPTNPTHPAFTNLNCKQCGAASAYPESQPCPGALGCCINCCDPEPKYRLVSQTECYGGLDLEDPRNAHILWSFSVNGVDCSAQDISECNPPPGGFKSCP
jgi:hypothetical protein